MDASEYVVGDRVEFALDEADCNERIKEWMTGTVCCIKGSSIGVEWDEEIDGHSCGGICKPSNGWFVLPYEIRYASGGEFDFDETAFESLYGEFKIRVDEEK